jgi:protein-S-isoprenylcysteine O-methyltransferase Ste14
VPRIGRNPLAIVLAAVAVVLLVVAVVFFATSHPLRGIVLIVLTVLAGVGAWIANRTTKPSV